MAELLLFHHIQGLTVGVVKFADALRDAGHRVHTPDLFDGRTFATIEDGMAHVEEIGLDTVFARGAASAAELSPALVYGGFSLGVLPAQQHAQTRPGARGTLLYHSCIPASEFGGWPDGVPVQIHGMDADPFFAGEGDIDAARELVAGLTARDIAAELFLYRGDAHLFADRSLSSFDEDATALVLRRTLAFLSACG
ncbi:MAG: dienelactone hydrolase family protein [Microbacteriaceae bacterium]